MKLINHFDPRTGKPSGLVYAAGVGPMPPRTAIKFLDLLIRNWQIPGLPVLAKKKKKKTGWQNDLLYFCLVQIRKKPDGIEVRLFRMIAELLVLSSLATGSKFMDDLFDHLANLIAEAREKALDLLPEPVLEDHIAAAVKAENPKPRG